MKQLKEDYKKTIKYFVENKIFINGYVSFYFAKKKSHEALFYYDRFCFAPC